MTHTLFLTNTALSKSHKQHSVSGTLAEIKLQTSASIIARAAFCTRAYEIAHARKRRYVRTYVRV